MGRNHSYERALPSVLNNTALEPMVTESRYVRQTSGPEYLRFEHVRPLVDNLEQQMPALEAARKGALVRRPKEDERAQKILKLYALPQAQDVVGQEAHVANIGDSDAPPPYSP